MKKIPLSRGFFAVVDSEDYKYLEKIKWHYNEPGYAIGYIKSKAIKMHRLIMNAPKGMDVDHINGDTLDNRKENLRICDRFSNSRNRVGLKNATSIYKGVSWDKSTNKWIVAICKNYKSYTIGRFKDELQAAMAYDIAAKELHGQYARLNF